MHRETSMKVNGQQETIKGKGNFTNHSPKIFTREILRVESMMGLEYSKYHKVKSIKERL